MGWNPCCNFFSGVLPLKVLKGLFVNKIKGIWIAASIGILLFICTLTYTLAGYIPVAGKYMADSKLSLYSGEKINTRYQFPTCRYIASGSGGKLLQYNLYNNTIFDEAYNDTIANKVNRQYLSFIAESSTDMIDYPGMLSIWTSIDATETSEIYAKVYVMTIFDEGNIDEQDSEQQICEFAVQLIEYLDINCTSIQMVYANKWGLFELLCDSGKKPLEYNDLAKNIRKFSEEELPLDYIEWRKALTC